MSVTWCLPCRLTVLTMYSLPTRYSCASTAWFSWPRTLWVPCSLPKAARTWSVSSQKKIPSLPALLTGLSTTRPGLRPYQSSRVSASVARSCSVPGIPAALAVSIMRNLSRRVRLCAVPLVGRPSSSLSSSASMTARSMPGSSPIGACASMAASAAATSPSWTMLATKSSGWKLGA